MSKADFEYMLNKKFESGTLYYTTMTDGRAIWGCKEWKYQTGIGELDNDSKKD